MFNTRRQARQHFVRLRSNDKVRCSKFESPATTFYAAEARTIAELSCSQMPRRSDVHDVHMRRNVLLGVLGTELPREKYLNCV